jgi:transglutaminase-like putative cysteine protease
MRIRISHTTEYAYDAPLAYALQRLRLSPRSGPTQTVGDWTIRVEGATEEVGFDDHFGNDTRLIGIEGQGHRIAVTAEGEVETKDTAGVFGPHRGNAPLWLFEKPTALTLPGEGIAALAKDVPDGDALASLHALMGLVAGRVAYEIGATEPRTSAEEAFEVGKGVCQDHAHIFIAAARLRGFPARYVSGYLLMEGRNEQVATHAWAEAHVPSLGWVAFDTSNGISADERYVRLAVGRDYRDAAPVSGIRLGNAQERLAVNVTVEQ